MPFSDAHNLPGSQTSTVIVMRVYSMVSFASAMRKESHTMDDDQSE
jgi:hypothetical protein